MEDNIRQQNHRLGGKAKTAIACGALACAISTGAAMAYLTDAKSLENRFNLETDLSIELAEPSFSPESAFDIFPNQTVAKDPQVTNTGKISAYIAATVKIPIFDGEMLDESGKLATKTNADLFTYSTNDGWSLIGQPSIEDGYRIYTYIYDSVLEPNMTTHSVFDDVTLANLTQDIGISETSIDISAFAIQSTGFEDAEAAWNAYAAQNLASTKATI